MSAFQIVVEAESAESARGMLLAKFREGAGVAEFVASAARKPREGKVPAWCALSGADLAAHLLATPTLGDRTWTGEQRLPRESRVAFIRRVLLGEVAEVEVAA